MPEVEMEVKVVKTLDKSGSPIPTRIVKGQKIPFLSNSGRKYSKTDLEDKPVDKPGTRSVGTQDDFREGTILNQRINMYLAHEKRLSEAYLVMKCFRQIYPDGEKSAGK